MKTLIFIHGGESFKTDTEYQRFLRETYVSWQSELWNPESKSNWVQEIAKKWHGNGDQVFMPVFPNKLNARYPDWKIVFEGILSKLALEDDITFVGGSLGGCFLLKYFSDIRFCHSDEGGICPEKNTENEQMLPIVSMTGKKFRINQIHLLAACIAEGDFIPPSNYEFLQKIENRVHIWHAEDDSVVPLSVGEEIAKNLPNAETHFFSSEKGYGHFHGAERIPELENIIL